MSIDLGQTYSEPASIKVDKDSKNYPSFHYSGSKDLDLPDEGTMVIKFKVCNRSTSEYDGKSSYSYTIDVCSIEEVNEEEPEEIEPDEDDAEAPAKSYDAGTKAALAKLLKEALEKNK